MRIYVAGIGPGSPEDITPAVLEAIKNSDVIIGYKYYFQFITPYLNVDACCVDTGMKHERERAEQAFKYAEEGKNVCVISSGDSGIYGMAPLIFEMQREFNLDVDIIVIPGISAFQKAAALLGAPMGHDFCVISLSDLMTPWQLIEKRIKAAASADFVTAVYNPKSKGRYWQLHRLKELFLQERNGNNIVGIVRQAGREEESVTITNLDQFNPEVADMFTIIIIGNSQSYNWKGTFITPRGYYRDEHDNDKSVGIGQSIMILSFQTIMNELNKTYPLGRLWTLLHTIHTTADFSMDQCLWMDENATETIYKAIEQGRIKTIVTDVSMVASGIRRGAIIRLGIEVVCYINDPLAAEMATQKGITRAQACMRMAANAHPDALYVFGNAPTGLLELCDLIRKQKAAPAGIIAAPVGFVHVEESKHAVKVFKSIPKIIIEGRKGGSNIAATIVNSILTYPDAAQLKPGRDV